MRNKSLLYAGVAAPVLYVSTVFLGGLLRPGYSHIANAVSELTAAGAPNKALLDPLFILYNLVVVAFGVGIGLVARVDARGRKAATSASVSLIVIGALGVLLQLFFPQDPGGPAVTFAGTMHLVVSGITALGTMLAILCAALWFRARSDLRPFTPHSIITLIVVFVAGLAAAGAASSGSPIMGMIERVPILAFQQWLFVAGLALVARSHK